MLYLWITWALLTVFVLTLAVYRKVASRGQDAFVHLSEAEVAAIPRQATIAQRLDRIDSWGKTLTVVDVVFLAMLLGVVFYNAWQASMETLK
jgi:hypothetical protein